MALSRPEPDYRLIRGAMLSWDNTARRQHNPTIFHNFSCTAFRDWLIPLIQREVEATDRSPEERIVLINAWNEWAEGSHLEPDQKHGFGYLQAVYDALCHGAGRRCRVGPTTVQPTGRQNRLTRRTGRPQPATARPPPNCTSCSALNLPFRASNSAMLPCSMICPASR